MKADFQLLNSSLLRRGRTLSEVRNLVKGIEALRGASTLHLLALLIEDMSRVHRRDVDLGE